MMGPGSRICFLASVRDTKSIPPQSFLAHAEHEMALWLSLGTKSLWLDLGKDR